jgi:hypothetical protein
MSEVQVPAAPAPVLPPAPDPTVATTHRSHQVVGWVLIALGVLFLANTLLPTFDAWLAPWMFGALGIVFLAWYASRPERPWPILAGGSLLSIAAVTAWTETTGLDGGTVFLLGLAVTFAAYAAAPPQSIHRRWGYWVGAACLVLAVLATGFSWAWPLVLIALGAWLLLRQGVGRHA